MDYIFSDRLKDLKGNAIREIFKLLSQPGIISFAGGLPASSALPVGDVKEAFDELLTSDKAISLLQYGATEGYKPYLESGIEYVKRVGIQGIDLSNILGISGGQQGIDLSFKAFVNKGDVVLVEEPTYLAALHILKTYEGKAVGVKSNDDGIDVEDLEKKIISYKPKMIYLVPDFSNPTGKTIPLEHRKAIAEITAKYGVMLIEDNPYCELRFDGEKIPAIKSFDKVGNVIYLTSFSKLVSPGMRVGYAVAEAQVIRKLTIGKQATDVHTATLNQAVVDWYLRDGRLDPALARNIPVYREKRDAMLTAIEKYFPKSVKYTRPHGGLFIWATLPESLSAVELFPEAVARKVAYVTGSAFYPNEADGEHNMRLNYSNATLEQIDRGIKALGDLLKEKLGE